MVNDLFEPTLQCVFRHIATRLVKFCIRDGTEYTIHEAVIIKSDALIVDVDGMRLGACAR